MTPGKLYLIRGGHIIRYTGPHQGIGRNEMIREVTAEDARFLRVRHVALRARRMGPEANWIREVMAEVGVKPSKIPARFTTSWAP